MLVYEKKQKKSLRLLKTVLEGDSTTSPRNEEETESRDFNMLHRTMPPFVLKSVLHDNQNYMFERNLYSPEFFKFLVKVLESAKELELDVSLVGAGFGMDVVAHAFHNKTLPELVEVTGDLLNKFPDSASKLIDSLLAENMHRVSSHLLGCIEKTTRASIGNLFFKTLQAVEQSKKEAFMLGLLGLIPDAGKNWTRFQQYWELIRDLADSCPSNARFFLDNGAIASMVDFYLGSKSPLLQPGEVRSDIGNKLFTPNFDALIQTLAILDKYCATNKLEGEYQLSENEKFCLLDKEFYDKTLKSGYDGKALGKIIAHWSYEDLEHSQMIAQVLLKGLNEIDYEDVKGYYEALEMFLTIEDSFVMHRIEWILGFPVPTKINRSDLRFPYFGNSIINAIDDEVYGYSSTLCFGHSVYDTTESVLWLIWKHKQRSDHYCIMSISHLFSIALKNPKLAQYLSNIPPPTYQFPRYADWISDYIKNYKNYTASYASYSSFTNKREELGAHAESCLQEFLDKYPTQDKKTYLVGRTVSKQIDTQQTQDDVMLIETQYCTTWAWSKPNGKTNDTIPSKVPRSELMRRPPDESSPDDDELPNQAYVFKLFEIYNKSDETVRAHLEFKSENANYDFPVTGVTIEVGGHSFKDLVTIVKSNPEEDWGPVDYVWTISEPKPFTLKSDHDEFGKDSNMYYNTENVAVNVSDIGSDDDFGSGGKVSCPECTFINSSNALSCEMCFHSFSK